LDYFAILSSYQESTLKQEELGNIPSQIESDSNILNSKLNLSNEVNENEQLIASNENEITRGDGSQFDLKPQIQESTSNEDQNMKSDFDQDTNPNQSESEVNNQNSNDISKIVYSNSNYINNKNEDKELTKKQFDALEANDDQKGQSYGKNLFENLHNKELNIPVEESNENESKNIVNSNSNNNMNINSQINQFQANAVVGIDVENDLNAQEDGVDELENDDYV